MTEKKREAVYNREADKAWIEKNKAHKNYLSRRSGARGFIRTMATPEDLKELKVLIEEREGAENGA